MYRAPSRTRGTLSGSNLPPRFRIPHSAFRTHAPSARPSPYLLENTDVGLVTVTQPQVPIQRRRPCPRPLRPFDEHDSALARHVRESDVPGLVGRLEAVAVDVVDGSGSSFVVMHQRVRGTRRSRPRAQAAANRLHQSRL